MKRLGIILGILVLAGGFGASSMAADKASTDNKGRGESNMAADKASSGKDRGDHFVLKKQLGDSNYCHLRFPAIERSTLFSDQPKLQDPKFGRIVDYYGPCDHDPLGKAEVEIQRDYHRRERLEN